MNPETALHAHKLASKGMGNIAIAAKLKLMTATEARDHVQVGYSLAAIEKAQLTDADKLIVRTLASLQRQTYATGGTASGKSLDVDWKLQRYVGWCAATVKKRLGPLGFVEHRRNGHIWLTPAGWTVATLLGEAE